MKRPVNDELEKYLVPALERKIVSITALDVRDLSSYTDTIIIVECSSIRQVGSVAEHIIRKLKKEKIKILGTEGVNNSEWALLDYADVVIHIFESRAMAFFDIKGLWADAAEIDLSGLTSRMKKGSENQRRK